MLPHLALDQSAPCTPLHAEHIDYKLAIKPISSPWKHSHSEPNKTPSAHLPYAAQQWSEPRSEYKQTNRGPFANSFAWVPLATQRWVWSAGAVSNSPSSQLAWVFGSRRLGLIASHMGACKEWMEVRIKRGLRPVQPLTWHMGRFVVI